MIQSATSWTVSSIFLRNKERMLMKKQLLRSSEKRKMQELRLSIRSLPNATGRWLKLRDLRSMLNWMQNELRMHQKRKCRKHSQNHLIQALENKLLLPRPQMAASRSMRSHLIWRNSMLNMQMPCRVSGEKERRTRRPELL